MPHRLPRFDALLQRYEDERKLARILLEADVEEDAPRLVCRSADGHDWQRRRGLPVISRGTGGAIPGSVPLSALLANESRERPRT